MKVGTLNRHLRRGQELAFKREEPLVELVERALNQAGDAAARNFADQATEHLTAAAPAPTSTMIAVYPDPEQAVALAQPDGEPAEILHVTLAFLGDTDPDQAEAAVAVIRDVAARMETVAVEGVVGGIASFGSEPDAEEPLYPSILLPDVPGLAELRQAVCEALDAAGIPYARNHGWTPHMTLAYTSEPSPPSAALMGSPLTFDRLTLARGDVPRDFPLGRSLAAAAGPPGWSAPHADEVFDVEALVQMLRTKSDPVRRAAIKAGMTGALEAAGLNFDATNPYVGKVLSGSAAQVTSIAETTRLNVMRTIREAYEEGLSIPDTAEVIRAGMRAAAPARARLIARTELAGVVNGGAVAAASIVGETAGVAYYKRWLTAPGAEYPRHEEYEELDGQTVDLDASFDVGGYQLEYPGDPGGPPEEVCNCRCTVIMVESGDLDDGEAPDSEASEKPLPEGVDELDEGAADAAFVALQDAGKFSESTATREEHAYNEIGLALQAKGLREESRTLVIRDETGLPQAAINYQRDGDAVWVAHLGSVVKGGGTSLLANAARDAASGNLELGLTSTPDAVGFYKKLGFKETDEPFEMTLSGKGLRELADRADTGSAPEVVPPWETGVPGAQYMAIPSEGLEIYRTEQAHAAYKGKAVWGEGRYFGTDREAVADLQLDPDSPYVQEPDLSLVDAYRLPVGARILDVKVDDFTSEQLRENSGEALRGKVLAGGYDGVHIVTESANYGGDQIVLYRSLAEIEARLAAERDASVNPLSRQLRGSAPPADLTSDATDEEANVKRGATIDPQTLDPQALSALAERARGPAPSIFQRRHATREALTAAGIAQPKLVSNYEMTQGSLADRWFIQAAIEAGFSELASDSWPTESDHLTDDKRIVFRDGDHGAVYRLEDGTVVSVSVGYGRCRVMTAGPSGKVGRAAIGAFRSIYPASYLVTEGDNRVPITFWMNTQFGPRSRLRRIESSTWEDVEGNYPAAIRDELSSIMAWNDGPDSDGQLLLFQGEPGTGKTWVLRALASQWASWAEFHYITDPDSFFVKDSSYMVDVLLSDSYDVIDPESGSEFTETDPEGKWRVLILEDTGELLAANAKEAYGQGLSRLLNVVDGMIGQGLRVLAVVTTNDELGDLHPAVKRDGRCAVSLEFGAFSPSEASEWLGEAVEEGGTLAELYARKAGSVEPRDLEPGEVLEEGELAASATAVELGDRAPAWVPVTLNVTTRGMELDDSDLTELGRFVAEAAEFQVEVRDLRRFATDIETPPELAPRDVRPPRGETPTVPDAEPATKASQVRWEGTLVVEGKITDDGRYIEPGATTWRELPLTLMAQIVTADGHDEARVAGRIDEIWRGQPNPDGSIPIFGRGVFDDSEFGLEVARMVEERVLRGNSVDLAVRRFELAYREDFDENGHRKALDDDEADPGESDPIDVLFGRNNVIVFTDCVIGASTVCSFPAFADAQISLAASGGFVFTAVRPINWVLTASGAPPEVIKPIVVRATQEELEEIEPTAVQPVEPVAASAAGLVPIVPPAEWFANPEFEELTALTVNDEGRVLGHLAEWDTCHIGIPGVCVTPPHSLTNYAYFHLAEVEVEGGDRIACGKITLGTGHAAKHLSRQAAAEHYDHTGAAVADIIVGEDDFGPWVAGALRPDVSAERVRELAGATLSGDWRNVNNNLELVAVLAVNVPGFPVPRVRADIVASGQGLQVMSLTAAGIYDGVPIYEKVASIDQARLAAMRARAFGGLQGLAELARGQAAA